MVSLWRIPTLCRAFVIARDPKQHARWRYLTFQHARAVNVEWCTSHSAYTLAMHIFMHAFKTRVMCPFNGSVGVLHLEAPKETTPLMVSLWRIPTLCRAFVIAGDPVQHARWRYLVLWQIMSNNCRGLRLFLPLFTSVVNNDNSIVYLVNDFFLYKT